jgi:energy-coupling factor transport system permease protein
MAKLQERAERMKSTLNTRTIIVIALALSSIVVIRQNITTQLGVIIMALILLVLQEERRAIFSRLTGRLKHFWIAFLAIMILQVLFRRDGDVIFQFHILKITQTGIYYGITVALRLINLILIADLLFRISSAEYMLAFKAWHIPFEISFLITTVIRFIPDYYRLFLAYRETLYLRNIEIRKLSIKNKLSVLVALLIPVLTANLADVKSRAVALDMKAFRLYPQRTYLHEARLRGQDYLIQFLSLIIFLFVILVF